MYFQELKYHSLKIKLRAKKIYYKSICETILQEVTQIMCVFILLISLKDMSAYYRAWNYFNHQQ